MQDAVGVDVEGHFDLRHATWSWWNVGQVELAQGLVLCGLLTLALQHVNGHGALVVVGSREHLRFLGRNRGVFLDQRGHHATHGFDTQGQRADVEQQNVFHVTGQYRALDGSTHGNRFVRVDVFTRFFAEEFGNQLLNQWHTGLTAHQDHVVDRANVDTGIFHCDAARFDGALNQVFHQCFQLGAGDLHVQVLRTGGVCSDVRQVHVGRLARGQFDLGFFSGFFQALHGQRVTLEVHAAFFLEFVDEVVDQTNVKVFTAQERVTVGGQYFELVLAIDFSDLDHGNVESTAAQVVNDHGVIALGLVHTVSQSSCGWFVDDTFYVQTGDAAGVFGRLTLAVVEVGRNGDHRFSHGLAEVVFGGLLHFLQDFSRDLWRRHFLAVHFNPGVAVVSLDDLVRDHLNVFLHDFFVETTTDQTLHRVQGVVRIGHGLTLGRLANQDFAIVGVSDDRRRGTRAFSVFNNFCLAVFQHGDAGVGSPQVDTDNFAHVHSPETLDLVAAAVVANCGST
ncbi:NAD-specific glutamate dehydrogenase [compost metagenome]